MPRDFLTQAECLLNYRKWLSTIIKRLRTVLRTLSEITFWWFSLFDSCLNAILFGYGFFRDPKFDSEQYCISNLSKHKLVSRENVLWKIEIRYLTYKGKAQRSSFSTNHHYKYFLAIVNVASVKSGTSGSGPAAKTRPAQIGGPRIPSPNNYSFTRVETGGKGHIRQRII